MSSNKKSLFIIGGVAAFLQLATITGYSIALAILGPKFATAEEFFLIYQESPLASFLRGDFLLLVLIGLYLGTFPTLYVALREINPIYAALATLFTILTISGTFATESTFALKHLGEQYAATSNQAVRAQLVAAGEAVIASDMWNSSGAYMGGILLQGSGVMISVIMLRSKNFSKVTAYSGIIANGFDLIQHVLHPFAPAIAEPIQMFMGVFYLVWFPMLGWDMLKIARRGLQDEEIEYVE
jgi:hypothetical protein